jgi:hypothetical protein
MNTVTSHRDRRPASMSNTASPSSASSWADNSWLDYVEQLSIACSCSGDLLSTEVRLFPPDLMLTAKQLQQQPTGQQLHDYIQQQTEEARAHQQQQQQPAPLPSASPSLPSLLSAQAALLTAAAAFNSGYDADLAHLLAAEDAARASDAASVSLLTAAVARLAALRSSSTLDDLLAAAARSQSALSALLPLLQRRASALPAAAVPEQREQELRDWATQLQATLTDSELLSMSIQ